MPTDWMARKLVGLFLKPPIPDGTEPGDVGLQGEEIRFRTRDGCRLHGWWLPAERPRGTVLSLHGAGHTVGADLKRVGFLVRGGYDVLAFDYRGFGRSEGRGSSDGLWLDCVAALRQALVLGRGGPLYAYGRSLGGAMALPLAAFHREIQAVISVAPPPSLQETVRDHPHVTRRIGRLGARILSRILVGRPHGPIRYANLVSPTPVLVVLGRLDRVIPEALMRSVHDALQDPRALLEVADGGHDPVTPNPQVQASILAWMEAPIGS